MKFSQAAIDRWLEEQSTRSSVQPSSAMVSTKLPLAIRTIIDQISEKIVIAIHPRKIILFGSYSLGTQHPDSDVDLCVIHSTTLRKDKRARIVKDLLFPYPRPLDIVVYTPEEFEELKDIKVSLLKKIIDEGIILYDQDQN